MFLHFVRLGQLVSALSACVAAGCTSFATVRSADVTAGPAATLQVSGSTPPGDDAAWFWSFDCADRCDHPIAAADAAFSYGFAPPQGPAYTLGAGLSGLSPYLESYIQLSRSKRPFGVGARIGVPLTSWFEYQLYGRFDVPLAPDARLLWNPGFVSTTGTSPNGENPGSFHGFTQGVGLQLGRGHWVVTPSTALVFGRAERNSYGVQFGPTTKLFATFAISVGYRNGGKDSSTRRP